MKKRLISVMTALALCLSLLPATALAGETPSYSIENGTLVISGTTDGSDLPTTGFTSIKITSTGVVTGGTYTSYYVENYGTISGGNFGEVMNRNGGSGSSLALIEGGTFEKVNNYGNMTGGTVGTLRNIDTTNYGHTVQGVTVTGSLYNNNSNCNDMTLNITLDKVTNILSFTTVRQSVDGEDLLCPVGQKANSWLKTNVADADWYRLNGEEWVKLTDTDVFPCGKTVYSKIPGMSLGTTGWMTDIYGNQIAPIADSNNSNVISKVFTGTIGVFNSSAVWYVGGQQVTGTFNPPTMSYTVTEDDIGKDAVAVLTDGYATIRSIPIRIVEPLSVTVPAAVTVGETITPVFNWQLKENPTTGMTYQWQRDGADIDGATSYTYTTTQSDWGHELTLTISVKGTPYYATGQVAVAAAVTITGVSAATELEYNGMEQTGYTGTPTSDYNGDYDITYTGRNGTVYDSTTPPTNVGDYTVTFAVPAGNTFYVGRESLDFSIAKATIVIQADDKTAYVGDTAPELTYTATGLVSGETLKTEPTLAYETEPDMTKAGTTAIKASGAEAPEGGNYDITYVDGTLTVNARPSSGGSSTPTYPPIIEDTEDGTVTVSPKSPAQGVTVTITPKPEEGYEVDQVTVTGKDGKPVEVTDNGDGTFTFKQPSGKVTVTVTFKEKARVVFVDVPANAYYYDAVYWAVANGITEGTNEEGTLFSPNAPCTRAQAVTFLWRAAGCPEPETAQNSFTDVAEDTYYLQGCSVGCGKRHHRGHEC